MLPRIGYLDFAMRWFAQVRFDLASSGVTPVAASELGEPPAPDDFAAHARFRAAVAQRYGVPEAEVVPCLGASGAVFTLLRACVERGERALVETPGYEPLVRVAEGLGIGVDRFERSRSDGFAIDPERVIASLSPETRIVVVTNPHNPSGVLASEGTLSSLARALEPRGILLFVDEAYLELAEPRTTARRLGDNVVACASATKCWGVPWARAGWALLPEALAANASQVERHVAGRAPPVAWAWGERAISQADALLERARRLQVGKRELADAFVARHAAELEWVPPHASSLFGFVRDRRGVCSLARIERGVAEHGVVVSPGEFFAEPGSFRLGLSAEKPVIEQGLGHLESVLELTTLREPR